VLFAFVFTVTGLIITAFYDIKPGGTIVLIGIAVLLVLLVAKRRR
jgi:ABC-type Mn2+/Zn2+ transport system permease subunit